ncbi:hypothetical protein AB0J01_28270 [Streptomyces sp. NPDC050204]|uniref:hypothetical protein n=1 Tax=Streptomyces sp. NPDC050204 TaxID=3155514 RepID=UPI00342518B6
MSTLLIGRWDGDHTLTITESHHVEVGDQAAVNEFVEPAFANGADWACTFGVKRHKSAVQCAYEQHARDKGARVQDDVRGFKPVTNRPVNVPAPGTEYPYAVSDIAHRALCSSARTGGRRPTPGASRARYTPDGENVTIGVDHEGDLYVNGPTSLEPVYLTDVSAPHDLEALTSVAEAVIEELLQII